MARVAEHRFVWQPEYAIGIEDIDAEHRALFRTADELWQAVVKKRRRDISALFSRLLAYARFHFDDEEAIMRQHRFPDYDEHCWEHRRLRARLAALDSAIKLDPKANANEAVRFLESWLVQHICGSDQKFGAYLRERV